jgi:hypothetical protein
MIKARVENLRDLQPVRQRRQGLPVGKQLFLILSVISILFNFLTPFTHSAFAAVDEYGYVEICTQNGVEKVRLSALPGASGDEMQMGEPCPACPDCPLCWFGKEPKLLLRQLHKLTQDVTHYGAQTVPGVQNQTPFDHHWVPSAPRAPPVT